MMWEEAEEEFEEESGGRVGRRKSWEEAGGGRGRKGGCRGT